MNIPKNVKNPRLYKKAYDYAIQKYGKTTSAYRSMAIVKKYKELGGTYNNSNSTKSRRTTRWLKEQWIMVIPYIQRNEIIPCGAFSRRRHACRPFVKVDKEKTPTTIQELLKKHGKKTVLTLAKQKQQSKQVRIDWNKATVHY